MASLLEVVVVVAMPVLFLMDLSLSTNNGGRVEATWCMTKSDASDQALQTALDYACGARADCAPIQSSGLCYLPNTLQSHVSYAFNSYYQRRGNAPGSCDFSDTATVTRTDPSYGFVKKIQAGYSYHKSKCRTAATWGDCQINSAKTWGPLACELARHAVVHKVNDWVFFHGDLLPHHVTFGIERMNREVSNWMGGLNERDDSPKTFFIATKGYNSVVWNHLYSRDISDLNGHQINQIQSILEGSVQVLGAKAMWWGTYRSQSYIQL
ncbi:hypothetical protein TEA_008059 [Camellia sinensis var. sinensis]|uniref:X8 domain-containing protein n=1 Tax=Camellia sinensis var. sinensis TaxID=542762 RepID=A0A4S4DAV3_CAMSN|nr:hypothetical protein TEA_008059 [Camellia sinensis var. sinensis]